ncbi:MAG: hypothetical protein M3282_12900 [Gemmatimonadota bacterium]|nr:hypothetical protein [Gemmatimonadota bacterium]
MYRQLDESKIIRTLEHLRDRIGERFPEAGLRKISEDLLALAHETSGCVEYLRRPNWPLRLVTGATIVGMVALLVMLALSVPVPAGVGGLAEVVQGIEAAVNDVIFFGLAVFFLLTIEARLKRRRALKMIHQLRSLAHIVDMHQLTKDHERAMLTQASTPTALTRAMTLPELEQYLGYCSELLSVTSKVAALLVQYFDDAVVLASVNEIEDLTTALSSKIWQKITILDRALTRAGYRSSPPSAPSVA